MDHLQDLWELYEAAFPKPELRDKEDEPQNIEAPIDPDLNFRVKQTSQIAKLRQIGKGKNAHGNAYEIVKGALDTGDPIAMADFAGHLAANQKDRSRAPRVEKDSNSIYHQDMMKQKNSTLPDDGDLRRPRGQELDDEQERMNVNDDEKDRLQTSSRGIKGTLDKFEEVDYYDDVQYLQTYGRA